MRIKDLATRTAKLITGNAYFGVDNGANEVRKIDYKELAKQIIEEYNLSTLAGSAQSVQGALNALNSNLVTSGNSKTATSSSGNFVTLCDSDGTYAVYVSDTNNNYCYGQFTIKVGTSNKWTTISNSGIDYDVSNSIGTIVFRNGTGTHTAKVTRLAYTPSNATVETLNNRLTNSIIQVTWGTEATFTLATNHRFVAFVAANCVYTGINYSDRLTCSAVVEGGEGYTMTAARDGTSVTITLNKAANISILTF